MRSAGKAAVRESREKSARQSSVASRTQPDDPLDHVVWHIGRAYYAYVGFLEQLLNEAGLDGQLCPGMGHILFALFEQDDRSIKDIAVRVHLSCSTLTGMLTRMEHARVIERRRDENDGRMVRVRLTSLGRSLEPRCRLLLQKITDLLHGGMGAEDVLDTKRLLQRLIETMRGEEQRLRTRQTGTRTPAG